MDVHDGAVLRYSYKGVFHFVHQILFSLPLIQEGQLSVSGEKMCTLVNRLED